MQTRNAVAVGLIAGRQSRKKQKKGKTNKKRVGGRKLQKSQAKKTGCR
jgi:hypothetical protein